MDKFILKSNAYIKISIIALITILIMISSSILIYSEVSKPRFYNNIMELGKKYLQETKYEEAIVAFDKAIKIESKSTEARVESAKGYIGKNDIDSAIDKLEEAQQIDIKNEKLLMIILEILKDIDSDIAYEILQNYIDAVGKENVSKEIQTIIEKSEEIPNLPKITPEPGTYVKQISVKIETDKGKIGHRYYYTLDGSEPSEQSSRYKEDIKIVEDTNIKLIGYNSKEDKMDIVQLEYKIDSSILGKIENLVNVAQELVDKTKTGKNVGESNQESKDKLVKVIQRTISMINKEIITYDEADDSYMELQKSIDIFKSSIIQDIEKKILGKYFIEDNSIVTFTKNEIIIGWRESEIFHDKILNRRIEGNKIYYDIEYAYYPDRGSKYGEMVIEVIDGNTINFYDSITKLYSKYELIRRVESSWYSDYNLSNDELVNALYNDLQCWGITKEDVINAYKN